MTDKNRENALAAFVAEQEKTREKARVKEEVIDKDMGDDGFIPVPRSSRDAGADLRQIKEDVMAATREEIDDAGMGYLPISLENLPSKGQFYPEGTKIYVRAATNKEIRYWSTISDDDLSAIDDAFNYVIERCMRISFPSSDSRVANWRDLVDLDRIYILLSIREFTFRKEDAPLKVSYGENKEHVVSKDDVKFMNFDHELMKHYDAAKRCFTFVNKNNPNKILNIYMPTTGVSTWLKNYVQRKAQQQQDIDRDIIKHMIYLIKDFRNLNDMSYEQFLYDVEKNWGRWEFSVLAAVQEKFRTSVKPQIEFMDEQGGLVTTGLNFLGGIKGIFLDMESIF